MGFFAAVVLFGLFAFVASQYSTLPINLGIEVPEITEGFFEDILQYIPCVEGTCEYSLITPSEPEEIMKRSPPIPLNQDFCKEIAHGLHDIDIKYPKLKDMKTKLYNYFFISMAEYERNPSKRQSIAVEVLSELIKLLLLLKERIEDCKVTSVPEVTDIPIEEEIIAEEVEYPGFVGSVRGIPGVNYPNYTEVPLTSFTCSDKKYTPGFYADLETGCQVFHVCYDHRRESFLCPIGTVFNQPILACDYWYSSNCSLAPHYYDVNDEKEKVDMSEDHIEEVITTIIEQEKSSISHIAVSQEDSIGIEAELDEIFKFLPVKAKVVEYPKKPVAKPLPYLDPKFIKAAVAVPAMKVVPKAVPMVKSKLEDIIKAKFEEAMKAKVASKVVPVMKVKAAGVAKTKLAAAAVPVVKAKVMSAAVPLVKAKFAAAAPLLKAKVLPVVKAAAFDAKMLAAATKAKKALMISPLTKKALALGYLKLLKAKKLALMG